MNPKLLNAAIEALQDTRNPVKAAKALVRLGVSERDAITAVTQAHHDLKWAIRKKALVHIVLSCIALAALAGLFAAGYMLRPTLMVLVVGGGCFYLLYGVGQFIFAAGYSTED